MRSILSQISLQEFQTLRDDEELSNLEIAQRLDVSYATVLKILGPQPKGLRKKRQFYGRVSKSKNPTHLRVVNPNETESEDSSEPKEAALISIDRPLVMGGRVGVYTIHPVNGKLDIEICDQCIRSIDPESIDTIITELERVRGNYKKVQRGDLTVW